MSTLTQEWTEKLAAWRSSGLSIAAWCRQGGEGCHRFLYWGRRLESSPSALSGRFVELTVSPGRSALCLECNGVYLHVDRGFDSGLLNDILSLLKKL
jgi:hypothetical protein